MKRVKVILPAAASLIALAFLCYTLLNLEALGITLTHPRVLVEASFCIGVALLAAWEARR